MVKGLIRFALIWAISMLLAPYVSRLFDQLAERVPEGSFLEDTLRELSDRHASSLIRAFGETLGDVIFGAAR